MHASDLEKAIDLGSQVQLPLFTISLAPIVCAI